MKKVGEQKELSKKEKMAILYEEAHIAANNESVEGLDGMTEAWPLPPGLGEWKPREKAAGSNYPGIKGPICEYRQGMVLKCPCGIVGPPNHCGGCRFMKFDGAFYRVVLHRACTMHAALKGAGYPAECVPEVVMPPCLPPELLGTLVDSGIPAVKWVLEEEDRVAKGEFGDYEAYVRTPGGVAIAIGKNRKKILKGAGTGSLSRLPWQTPLVMLYEAESKRQQLPSEERGDEEAFRRLLALKWKGILLQQYQNAAKEEQEKAAAMKGAPVGAPDLSKVQPNVVDLLGIQDSPAASEGSKSADDSSGPNEEDTKPPAVAQKGGRSPIIGVTGEEEEEFVLSEEEGEAAPTTPVLRPRKRKPQSSSTKKGKKAKKGGHTKKPPAS
jgi:hypothetical protein